MEAPPTPARVYRHRLLTRLWHWINAVAVIVLTASGLMISNAHPRLYWGEYGANYDHAWLELPRWPGWLTLFTIVHLTLVILAGPVNELRSMITGWWRVPEDEA